MNRMQIQQRIRTEREEQARPLVELAYAIGTGCECHECQAVVTERPAPMPVPELLTTRGGTTLVVTAADRERIETVPFHDVWGDAR